MAGVPTVSTPKRSVLRLWLPAAIPLIAGIAIALQWVRGGDENTGRRHDERREQEGEEPPQK